MLNIIQNTIGAIRRVGESVVRAGLKMWLPFTKAEPLGEELVVNGDFSTDSDWNLGSGQWSISNGFAVADNSNNNLHTNLPVASSVGLLHKITFTLQDVTQGYVRVGFSDFNPTQFNSDGTYTLYIVSTGNRFLYFDPSGFTGKLTNVSVKFATQETPDISGNDNDAILKTGKALQFSGNDSVETSFPSSKTIKTIAFWIYPTHSASHEVLFNLGITNIPIDNLGDRVIELDHLTIHNRQRYPLNFDVYIDGVYRGETNYNGDNPTLEENQWQRVVFVNSSGTSTVNDTFDIAYTGSGSHGRFKMSDLQIYGAEFTTDDIAYDYANPQKLVTDNASSNVTLNDLHAWWHMSEGDGTIAFDSAPLLGKELVVNGDFATDSDWITETGWTIENGKANKSGTTSSALRQNINLTNARVFQLTFDISERTIGSIKAQIFGGGGADVFFDGQIGNGSYSFTTTSTTDRTAFNFYAYGSFDGSIDNVSIKEVYNIDGETYDGSSLGASYVDAQERIPQLGMINWSKASNLLTYSEDFSESEWHKGGSPTLESGYLAPDGTMTAYKITVGTATTHIADQFVQTTSDRKTKSLWARTVSGTGIVTLLNYFGENNSQYTLTEEWQRFEVSGTLSSNEHFYLVDFRHANNSLNEVIVWGAQLEADDGSVTAYRRTNGTAVTDATLISCATDSQKDILGNAVRVKGSGFNLDGTGYGEVQHDSSLDFGTGDFSVSAWVKFSYIAQGSNYNAIYTNGGQVDSADTFAIMSLNPNKIAVLVNGTGAVSTTTFNEGEWVHIVVTRNSGTISLYINGNKTPEDTDTNSNTVTSSQNPRIGWDSNIGRYYNDLIDDVQVYDRYLTPEEVEQNYNATKSGHNN